MSKKFIAIIFSLLLLSGCQTGCEQDTLVIKSKGDKIGVYGYLNESYESYCELADTWYPIEGIFINYPLEGFYLNASLPGIVYNGSRPRFIESQAHATMSSTKNGVTVFTKIGLNGSNDSTKTGHRTLLKFNDEKYFVSGNTIFEMHKGDYIQLIFQCDTANTYINFSALTTSANEFFH